MEQDVKDGRYEDVYSFVHDAMTVLKNTRNRHSQERFLNSTGCDGDWYGADCTTGKQVADKVNHGWPEGQARLASLRSGITITATPRDRRRRPVKTDFGDSVDIHAVYAGQLSTAWRVARRQDSYGPQRVSIFANMVCAGFEDAEVLFWRGAAAAVLADLLDAAGYMVRVVVGFGGDNYALEITSCRITVKDYDKPLDQTSLASILMPGFFRALGHLWLNGHTTRYINSPGISVRSAKLEDGELVLTHDVRDERSARAWIDQQIAKFNNNEQAAA